VAAHAAAAGLESYVFVPADLEEQKILATGVYDTKHVAVRGNYNDVNRLCTEISGEHPWAFVNVNMRPYYAEGSKTLAYEIAEQLGWQTPDRVVTVAITMARAFGFEAISCASTGNLANATAAHAAKAGMPCYVFVPEDLERAKILATEAYGAKVVAVKGNYDAVNRLCSEVAEALPWAFVNVNMRPYYAEGSKSLGFEVAEQLGWRLPDHVVVPIASGALMTKIHRAFRELAAVGAVEDRPYRISGAQPEGCSPVAQAFASNATEVRPMKPDTIARSLAIGSPADGWYAIQTARQTGGAIDACTEAEVIEGITLLAETEGVFTETAGGVTIAVLKRLVEQGVIRPEEETVALVTGNGYKTVEALEGALEPSYHVEPDLDGFLAALG